MRVSAEAAEAMRSILRRSASPYSYYRGHRMSTQCQICVDCGTALSQIEEGAGMSGDQCAQERVLRGRSAQEARQLAESELRMLQIDGVIYKEHKIYRGALCTGTRYHVADAIDEVSNFTRQGERK